LEVGFFRRAGFLALVPAPEALITFFFLVVSVPEAGAGAGAGANAVVMVAIKRFICVGSVTYVLISIRTYRTEKVQMMGFLVLWLKLLRCRL
jgi:hypothetical protein